MTRLTAKIERPANWFTRRSSTKVSTIAKPPTSSGSSGRDQAAEHPKREQQQDREGEQLGALQIGGGAVVDFVERHVWPPKRTPAARELRAHVCDRRRGLFLRGERRQHHASRGRRARRATAGGWRGSRARAESPSGAASSAASARCRARGRRIACARRPCSSARAPPRRSRGTARLRVLDRRLRPAGSGRAGRGSRASALFSTPATGPPSAAASRNTMPASRPKRGGDVPRPDPSDGSWTSFIVSAN